MLVHADVKLRTKISQALLRLNAIKPGNEASTCTCVRTNTCVHVLYKIQLLFTYLTPSLILILGTDCCLLPPPSLPPSLPPSPPPSLSPAVQRLSTASVPFTVLSMCYNPSHEDFLIVCGLKEAQLLVMNPSGQVVQRLLLHPSVDGDGYIVKVTLSVQYVP